MGQQLAGVFIIVLCVLLGQLTGYLIAQWQLYHLLNTPKTRIMYLQELHERFPRDYHDSCNHSS